VHGAAPAGEEGGGGGGSGDETDIKHRIPPQKPPSSAASGAGENNNNSGGRGGDSGSKAHDSPAHAHAHHDAQMGADGNALVASAHNAYRSQLAKGQAANKDGSKLPSGKNVYALVRVE